MSDSTAIPLFLVTPANLAGWSEAQTPRTQTWLKSTGFDGTVGSFTLLPAEDGRLHAVVAGIDNEPSLWSLASLPAKLPAGVYRLDPASPTALDAEKTARLALGWSLARYAFTRYKSHDIPAVELLPPEGTDAAETARLADAIFLARDLINTPAEDLGPGELANIAGDLAARSGAAIEVIAGDELIARNYPLIHAVGRAASRPPRLIDLIWGRPDAPRVTLVGKGVCFDSGGLDIKPSSGMKLMKKDMGGAATVLGLAQALIGSGLDIRLRVLIPAVENSISANAFRPMDVFRGRNGLTVEIGNTDAEGRLILADALTEAVAESPALLIDLATLTGAARVALGTDLPALFSNDDSVATDLLAAGLAEDDPLWRLPLYKPYRKLIQGKTADINNAGADGGMAGAITAALFLESFVGSQTPWVHIDTYAWNASSRPGRPEGGEALALRALYRFIRQRFG